MASLAKADISGIFPGVKCGYVEKGLIEDSIDDTADEPDYARRALQLGLHRITESLENELNLFFNHREENFRDEIRRLKLKLEDFAIENRRLGKILGMSTLTSVTPAVADELAAAAEREQPSTSIHIPKTPTANLILKSYGSMHHTMDAKPPSMNKIPEVSNDSDWSPATAGKDSPLDLKQAAENIDILVKRQQLKKEMSWIDDESFTSSESPGTYARGSAWSVYKHGMSLGKAATHGKQFGFDSGSSTPADRGGPSEQHLSANQLEALRLCAMQVVCGQERLAQSKERDFQPKHRQVTRV